MHDIRGCRCLFFIRYEHDGSEVNIVPFCFHREYKKIVSFEAASTDVSSVFLFPSARREFAWGDCVIFRANKSDSLYKDSDLSSICQSQFCIFYLGGVDLLLMVYWTRELQICKSVSLTASYKHWKILHKSSRFQRNQRPQVPNRLMQVHYSCKSFSKGWFELSLVH